MSHGKGGEWGMGLLGGGALRTRPREGKGGLHVVLSRARSLEGTW